MLHHKIRQSLYIAVIILTLGLLYACHSELESILHPSDKPVAISPLAKQLGFSKERPLVMGINTSYAPLQYVDGKGVPSGFDIEFTKLLMQRLGIPYTFSPNHWDKMSPGIIEGKYDLGMLVYSPYRKHLTNYSHAVFRMYYQIVYRKKDYTEFDFRHLKGKTIAYMKSRPIGLMLKDAGAKDVPITDLSDAFNKLSEGKFDGLICYRFQAAYNIDLLGLQSEMATEELSLEPREYCYASHDPLLIKAINNEIKHMEVEGIIDDVYGDDVLTQFGVIKIPIWLWALVGFLSFLFLVIFSINRYLLSKRLQQAHDNLQRAYQDMALKNEELSIANSKAEESTRMKTNFIKQISHEIRTPLNVLSGFTQIITSPDAKLSSHDKAEAEQQIILSTDRITGLVNKMLELSDISSHKVLERNDNVSALQIAEQAIQDSGIRNATHITFSLQFKDDADILFKTDRRAAVRILELVLDNAIKFTHSAEVFTTNDQHEAKAAVNLIIHNNAGTVRFVVEDTGIGIPTAEAEHIFDEFVQLDEYYNGTGIGLTVARSLARRLGGDVKLDTTCSSHTRFVITLKA